LGGRVNSFFAALQRFGIGRLAVLLGVGGGGAALLITILVNLAAPPMGLLYSNLDLREAGSITQALDQGAIKYQVQGDGSTIMVARDKVAAARLMLAGKGLPTSDSVGYEIFDTQNALGQTDFVQQLNMKRATEGELARTIRALDGVTYARVHLVLSERQLFQDTTELASAAVTIGIGSREPSTDQVRAVQNLVAGAVPNLKPEKVVVIDQHGKTLSAESDVAGKEAEDAKAQIEDNLRARVKSLVEGVVGAGKARVQISADVDMSQVTTQSEKYDPDGQVVRSEQTNDTSAKDNSGVGGGSTAAASASTNIPGAAQTAATQNPANGSENTGQESTTNYEISKTVTTQVQQPGTIKRLSVAVAVDGLSQPGKDGKPGPYAPRTAEEMQHLNDLVKAAIGFSSDRGDQVQVVNVRFPDAQDAEGVSAANPLMGFDKNDIMRTVELAVLAVVAGLILFFVIRPLLRSAQAGFAAAGGGALVPYAGGGRGGPIEARVVSTPDGQIVTIDAATGQPLALPGPDIEQKIDIARIEGQVKASSIKRVAEFVEKHPEESVSILRGWLHESV
jgi:flagellar M-ring protein FliF